MDSDAEKFIKLCFISTECEIEYKANSEDSDGDGKRNGIKCYAIVIQHSNSAHWTITIYNLNCSKLVRYLFHHSNNGKSVKHIETI